MIITDAMFEKGLTSTRTTNDFVPRWDNNHEGYRAIFNAALTGICANPHFFGPLMQQQPEAAVEFANEVVLAAIYGADYVPPHARAHPRQENEGHG